MKGPHPDARLLLSDEPPSDRPELLEHLRGCASCRAALAAEDASRLFGLLALEPVPEHLLERVSRAVEEGTERDSRVPGRSRAWQAASVAASLMLAASFATYVLQRDRPGPLPSPISEAPRPQLAAAEPGFELLSSPSEARVVDLAVGEVRLVMIFDEELDL